MAERAGRKRVLTLAGEALAIGLGVFLSLWADEWRTNRNIEADSRESLARVRQDISSDTLELARLSGVTQRRVDAIRALLAQDPGASGATAGPKGESFADVIGQAMSGATSVAQKSETVSMQAIANQADLNEIVTAVNNAEMTLQTVVAVRDKVIQAYQEILRMPI